MLTSSGQKLARRRALRNCTRLIFLSLICVAWNTANAQSATHTSTEASTNSVDQPSTETSYEFTRPTFDQATKYIYETVEQLQNKWTLDSKNHQNARQENAKPRPSHEHISTTHEAEQGVGHDQSHFDQPHPSSHTFRESMKFACEAAQNVRRMLNPSSHSFAEPDDSREGNSVSVDEALDHIRGIMHILGRTHNALLEKKLASLPLFQKLWLRYLHFYRDPYFAQNKGRQSTKFREALSDLTRSAGDLDVIFKNSDALKENANAVMGTFTKKKLQSLSTLKQSVRKAVHARRLMTPGVHPYVDEITQSFNALSKKWLPKIASLAKVAKPISDNMPSHEQMQHVFKEFEDMVTEFKDEVWRSRTEWMYQRGEALSWAKDRIHDLKHRAAFEFDRASENLKVHAQSARQMLKGSLERSKKDLIALRVRVSEHMERLIIHLKLLLDTVTRSLRSCMRPFVQFFSNSWRIFAFITIIISLRFLLGFVLVDDYVRSVLSRTISRSDANNSTNQGQETTTHGQPENIPSDSPSKSETSESGPTPKSPTPERKSPPNTSKPSRVRGTTSPEDNELDKHRVRRRERRTVAKSGNNRTPKRTTPLQVSNLHHQNTLTSLQKQMNGRPIHLGDHEVQLVYQDVPRDDATDTQRNGASRKRTSVPVKTKGPQGTTRWGEKQPGINLRTEKSDDVITVNSSDESTTSYGSASSRITRSSLRRASARRSQAP